jgi:hypothetical protein
VLQVALAAGHEPLCLTRLIMRRRIFLCNVSCWNVLQCNWCVGGKDGWIMKSVERGLWSREA